MDADADVIFFTSPADFRGWLEQNFDKVRELWLGFYKKDSGQIGITYQQAVDEALCFGWIDGVRKTIDGSSYKNRFTPRKKGSNWSAVNIKRVGELAEQGLMQPPGLKAFNGRDQKKEVQYSYENDPRQLSSAYEEQFRANSAAWEFFSAQPPYYRKTASWWVMSAKREETQLRRLGILIEGSEKQQRLAQVVGGAIAK